MINNRGQTFFLTLMIGIVIIIVALAFAPGLNDATFTARNNTVENGGMDCSNSSISTFNKATCVVADVNIFYFIGGLIFIAGAVITAKVISR